MACSPTEQNTSGVSDDTFVEVMVELRRAAVDAGGDAGTYSAARERILAEAGVTTAALEQFAAAHADDPVHMADLWERINDALVVEVQAR